MTDETHAADASDHDIDAPVELADKPREATPYEKRLRNEAAQYRRKMVEAEKNAAVAIAAAKAEAEALIAETTNKARERQMRAELKAHAVRHGLTDLDTLKLLDTSKAELSDDGEVKNADQLFETWKQAKPHFFGLSNTSSTASAPKQATQEARKFSDMSETEKRAFEREHGLGSRAWKPPAT